MNVQAALRRDLIHLMENRERLSHEAFAELLNEIVPLDGNGWEMGPDPEDTQRTILSVSALGDQAKVRRIEQEFNLPIVTDHWSIIRGIPPMEWEQYFEYTDYKGKQYRIEGSIWRHAIIHGRNGADIILDPDLSFLGDLPEQLGIIICIGEIGERNIESFVSSINYDCLPVSESNPISRLRADFVKLFPNCYYNKFLRAA